MIAGASMPNSSLGDVVRSPGMPLASAMRTWAEARFGHDFSDVRIHADPAAAASARALGANAYTIGRHVVFGAERYRPSEPSGVRLLAHELAHVVQQADVTDDERLLAAPLSTRGSSYEGEADRSAAAAVIGRQAEIRSRVDHAVVQRDAPSSADPLSDVLGESFEQRWAAFQRERSQGSEERALAIARDLVPLMHVGEAFEHGGDLAAWLLGRGERELASQAIRNLESAWWIRYVTNRVPPATLGLFVSALGGAYGPLELVNLAERQADADAHEQARELFGVAFLMLQMQYLAFSDERLKRLAEMSSALPQPTTPGTHAIDMPMIRLLVYGQVEDLLRAMRRILGFYAGRERTAIAEGRTADGTRLAALGAALRQRIQEQYLITGTGESQRGLTMEATFGIDRGRGPGYTLQGRRGPDEFVTPLPGEPRPDELGTHPAYTAPMQEVFATLGGQEDLLTELNTHPEIRRRFRGRPIDLNDQATRLGVWGEMIAIYQRTPAPGCATALCSLLRLMGRYLRNFTVHTQYNIDDFGVSYLDRQFPEDLLGRLVRDCGVYAVTVAYEVYRAARAVSPRLGVRLQLHHTLEHSMLLILDEDHAVHYLVNNDEITGPTQGDPLGSLGTAYAGTMGHGFGVSAAAASTPLGTETTDAAFRRRLWRSFETGGRLGVDPEPRALGDTRPDAERKDEAYRGMYAAMDRFDQAGQAGSTLVNGLAAAPGDLTVVEAALPRLTALGRLMATTIDAITRSPRIGLRPGPNVVMQREALLTVPAGVAVHPLVRIGKVLMFAEHNGHALTADESALLTSLRSSPFASIPAALTDYDRAGRPPEF
jgi:hypothetical protein